MFFLRENHHEPAATSTEAHNDIPEVWAERRRATQSELNRRRIPLLPEKVLAWEAKYTDVREASETAWRGHPKSHPKGLRHESSRLLAVGLLLLAVFGLLAGGLLAVGCLACWLLAGGPVGLCWWAGGAGVKILI